MYQRHSTTSRDAYASLGINTSCSRVINFMSLFQNGCINSDISEGLDQAPGTTSARLKQLEDMGVVVKTQMKRVGSSGKQQHVYVLNQQYRDWMGTAPVKTRQDILIAQDMVKVFSKFGYDIPVNIVMDAYNHAMRQSC